MEALLVPMLISLAVTLTIKEIANEKNRKSKWNIRLYR